MIKKAIYIVIGFVLAVPLHSLAFLDFTFYTQPQEEINLGAAPRIFTSGQTGNSPTNGDVLQTDGSVSTWVATNTLGITASGGSSYFSDLLDVSTSTPATGDIYYLNSSGQIVNLGIGSAGQFLEVSGGLPAWASTFDESWHISGSLLTPTTSIAVKLPSTTYASSTIVFDDTLNSASSPMIRVQGNSASGGLFWLTAQQEPALWRDSKTVASWDDDQFKIRQAGTITEPSLTFNDGLLSEQTGFWRPSSGVINLATGGSNVISLGLTNIDLDPDDNGIILLNSSSATSSFTNGINLDGGCFAIGSVCVGGGVTQIDTTYPVLGGPITTTGTIFLAFGTTTANQWSALQEFNGNASTTGLTVTGNSYLGGYTDFDEISAPTDPDANILRLWAEDSGGFGQLHFKNSNGLDYQLARDNIHTVRNNTGSTITKGSWVYINGSTGVFPTVALADADSLNTMPVAGIVVADITNNSFGQMMTEGDVENIDTSAFNDGDVLYASSGTAGEATATIPTGTNVVQRLGVVVKSSAGAGIIAVLIGGEFDPGLTQTFSNKTIVSPTITGTGSYEFLNGTTTNATTTTLFSSVASSTQLFTSNFTLGRVNGFLKATAGAVATALIDLANDVTGNLPVTNLDSGTGASASTFWRGDGSWGTPTFTDTPNWVLDQTYGLNAYRASTTNANIWVQGKFFASSTVGVGTSSVATVAIKHEAGEIPFAIGSSTRATLWFDKDGKLGMGTTSPKALFHGVSLSEPSTAEDLFRFDVNDAIDSFMKLSNGSSNDGLFQPSFIGQTANNEASSLFFIGRHLPADDNDTDNAVVVFDARQSDDTDITTKQLFDWRNNDSRLMVLDFNGNLGIGTTTPFEKLSVVGDTFTTATTSSSHFNFTGGGYSNYLFSPTGADYVRTITGAKATTTKWYHFSSISSTNGLANISGDHSVLTLVTNNSGIADAGSVEGYVLLGTSDNYVLTGWNPPDNWIDTGEQGSFVIYVDCAKTGISNATVSVDIYEYDNTTAFINDTVTCAATRALVPLNTNGAGIGNNASMTQSQGYKIKFLADDTNRPTIYGYAISYMTGLQN